MKRLLIILLTLITLTACNNTANNTPATGNSSETAQTESHVTSSEADVSDTSILDDETVTEENSSVVTLPSDVPSSSDGVCEHVYLPPTCLKPETCAKCGVTKGEPTGHLYSKATCVSEARCKRCGNKTGQILEHAYAAATCTVASTCKGCGIVDGEPLGHKWHSENCARCKVSINKLSAKGEKINIACIGDSITFNGYWKDDLYGNLPDYYNVSGFGVNGATGFKAGIDVGSPKAYINQTACEDSQEFAPHMVVIMLGTNDSKPCNWNKIKTDNGAQYIADIKELIGIYRSLPTEPRIFIALPPTAFSGSTNFEGINNTTIEDGIIPLLKSVAAETGATVIDTHSATQSSSAHFKDGVHPSDDIGREILAETVAEAIKAAYSS